MCSNWPNLSYLQGCGLSYPFLWDILGLLDFQDLLQLVDMWDLLACDITHWEYLELLLIFLQKIIAWSLCCCLVLPPSTLVVLFISICTWFAVEERVQNETWIMWRRARAAAKLIGLPPPCLLPLALPGLPSIVSLSHERPFLWTFVFMWQLVAQFYEGRHSKLVAKTRHGKWVISGLALRLNLRIDQLYVSTPAAFLPQKNLKETENSHPKYNLHFLCQMNCIISSLPTPSPGSFSDIVLILAPSVNCRASVFLPAY